MFRKVLLAAGLAAATLALSIDVSIAQPAAEAAPVVVAQPPIAPIVNQDGSFNFTPLMDGFIKFVGGVLGLVGAWILARCEGQIKAWFGIQVDTREIAKDIEMSKYADLAAAEVIRYAFQATGFKPDDLKNVEFRNPFLSTAATLLFKLDPKVFNWVSSQQDGVMKWLESHLTPASALQPKPVAAPPAA